MLKFGDRIEVINQDFKCGFSKITVSHLLMQDVMSNSIAPISDLTFFHKD